MKVFGFDIQDDWKNRESDIRDAIYEMLINPRISVDGGVDIVHLLINHNITMDQFYSYLYTQCDADDEPEMTEIYANLDSWNAKLTFSSEDINYIATHKETCGYKVKPTDIAGIVKYISERVIGQDNAIKSLVTAVWKHVHSVRNNLGLEVPAQLLIGPTGVGKTLILNTLSEILNFPIINIFASTITAPGYKGGDSFTDQIFSQVSQYSIDVDNEPIIIIVHEVDKAVCSGGKDGYNKELMSSIMSCIESTTIYKANVIGDPQKINLKNVLVLFDGCFDGIEKIIERRLGFGRVGFNQAQHYSTMNVRSMITRSDLREYGMTREFVGRLSYPICLNPMNEGLIYDILTKSATSPIKAYEKAFAKENMSLKFSTVALKIIAKYLYKDVEFGARSINAVLDKIMSPFMPLLSKPINGKLVVIGKKEVCKILGIANISLNQ